MYECPVTAVTKYHRLNFLNYLVFVLGLHHCVGFSLVAVRGGYSLVVVHGLLTAVASLGAEHRL